MNRKFICSNVNYYCIPLIITKGTKRKNFLNSFPAKSHFRCKEWEFSHLWQTLLVLKTNSYSSINFEQKNKQYKGKRIATLRCSSREKRPLNIYLWMNICTLNDATLSFQGTKACICKFNSSICLHFITHLALLLPEPK